MDFMLILVLVERNSVVSFQALGLVGYFRDSKKRDAAKL